MNMNDAEWDEHLSFSATTLNLSPDGSFLLASTDGPRIMVLRVRGAAPILCPNDHTSHLVKYCNFRHFLGFCKNLLHPGALACLIFKMRNCLNLASTCFSLLACLSLRFDLCLLTCAQSCATHGEVRCEGADWSKAKLLYGLHTAANFHQYSACWLGTSHVAAAAEGGTVFIFRLSDGKVSRPPSLSRPCHHKQYRTICGIVIV